MNTISRNDFGDDFLLGVATSSYQIEGAHDEDGRAPSIWDDFCRIPGNILNGDTGDIACDHYHRYQEDVDLMAWMGVDAYRFSIAWPRVLPQGIGAVNTAGLDFYERLVDTLLKKGIAPCATLYHWDLPSALKGGWLNRDTIHAFAQFASVVAKRLGDRVAIWFTHNEPWCQAFLGYEQGRFAPGHRNFSEALLAAHHLLVSHGLAVRALREKTSCPIGPALNFMPAHPASDTKADREAALRQDGFFNRWFADPVAGRGYPADMAAWYGDAMPQVTDDDLRIIAEPIDVMGVNYYERCMVKDAPDADGVLKLTHERRPGPHTADREIYPKGIREILERMHRDYGFDNLAVTENGAAFVESPDKDGYVADEGRAAFLKAHLKEILAARQAGTPINAYFAWSLMDNFEWAKGYSMRYGITHVDFKTQKRTPKASAHFLRSFSKRV